MVSTWHWKISSPLLILSGLGQLSQELLFCWQEAHGLAERNVDVALNSCLPYISTSTSFSRHFSEDSCVHPQAHPFSSCTILHLRVPPLYTSCPPCPNRFMRVTTMNNRERPPILDTTWIDGTSHPMSVPASRFLSGEPPRISVPRGWALSFPSPQGLWSCLLTPSEILPLDCHSSLSSCCPQCCMLSLRHTFSCYRGTRFFLLQGYSYSMCYPLGLEYSLLSFLLPSNSF